MADNILVPRDVAKTMEVVVKDTSAPLLRLLTDIINKLNELEERIKALENA